MKWLPTYKAPRRQWVLAILAAGLLSACQTTPSVPRFTAEQVALLHSYEFVEHDGRWELGLEGKLLFPLNESALVPEQRERLQKMASVLLEAGIAGCRVDGHTDSTGTAQYNQELSLRRATEVKTALVAGGMPEQSVYAVGMGATQPLEDNATEEGRQENRRVTVIIKPDGAYSY